jgi:peptide/nickel transport system permease protein
MAVPAQNKQAEDMLQGLKIEESPTRIFVRRFIRSKTAIFGMVVLGILVLTAIFAPWIAPEPWTHLDLTNVSKPPSADHWFGTDQFGRDLFSRIVWGARISLAVGFVAAGVSVTVGATWGAIAGYYGGSWLDVTMMRIAEAISAVPTLILLIVVSSLISRGLVTVMIVIGITSWPNLAFLVRGQILSLRERDYVQAALALGAGDKRIIFKHVLPNVFAVIVVNATLAIGGAILFEAALNFLGYGAPPPYPTWGEALATGRQVIRKAPWVTFFPGVMITFTVLAFNFIGDGLRDAWDPKMKR